MLTLFHALFFLSTARVAFSAENAFIWPPAARQTLFIPIGTPMIVQWNSTYANLNLRLYQKDPNGPFIYQSLLSKLCADLARGSAITKSRSQCHWRYRPKHIRLECAYCKCVGRRHAL